MAGELTIRGQEVTIQVTKDGEPQGGSFAKMESFTATPRTDLKDNDFIGEALSSPDIQHHGWDGNFTIREQGPEVFNMIKEIFDAEEASTSHPVINIIITTRWRAISLPSRTVVVQGALVKPDGYPDISGRTEYVKSTWSFKAKKVLEV